MIFKKKLLSGQKLTEILLIIIFIIATNQQCLSYYEYFDSTYSICMPCGYSCMQCFDSSSCGTCVDQFYINNVTNTCDKCPFGCMYCANALTCITCNTGLYIDSNGNCLSCSTGVSSCSIAVIEQCHNGYFLLGGICAECLDNCMTCEDFVTCTECNLGFYLPSNSQSCLSCSLNCEICIDSNTCISCSPGYSISNGSCVSQNCSMYNFCASCNSNGCLTCNKGKYLDSNGQCIQGASILCAESTGPYYTNCDVSSDTSCSDYAEVQYDQSSGNKLSVCLPLSATQYAEYIYGTNEQSNCVSSSCGSAYSQVLTITTRKSYYQVEYNLNIKFYKSSSHTLNISAINSTTESVAASNTHTVSISSELAIFGQSEVNCSSCPFGYVYITGTLLSNGYQQSLFNLTDQNGQFTVVEYVFVFSTCSVENCETCTTGSDCVLCVQPYFLQLVKCVTACDAGFYQYQRYCLLECPSDTFAIQSSYQCQACISPCLTCSSETQCLSCVDGYFLEGESCVINCSSAEEFGNVTSKECETCPNPCEKCQAVNSTYVKCLSCMVGYLYQQESCIFICPSSYYDTFLNEISQCSVCDSSCSDCYIESSTCSGCVNSYLLYESYCNQTTSCLSGYFISVNNTCEACQFPCSTCESSSTNCTSCLKGGLYQTKCYSSCPTGYFMDVSTVSNITCQICPTECASCLSLAICSSCANGYYYYENQCLSACSNQSFYANSLNNTCTSCSPPCKECTSISVCLSCLTGYLDGSSCTLQCNSSSYINSVFQCTLCPSPCNQCYSQSQCIQCTLPYVLNGSNCISVSDCEALGKYVSYVNDSTNTTVLYGECKNCTYPCATCSTSSILCSTCASGYLYLADLKTCQQQCPSTYYVSSNECLKCSSNCFECSISAINCTSCSTGTYLDTQSNQCVTQCSDGFYADNEQSECVQCVSPCATCYNVYFCKTCSVGIYYNKVCVTSCPSGTIFNSTSNECASCTNNCLTCSVTTSNCTSCISGYYFNSDNTCTLTCQDGYYADIYTQGCEVCISPCMKCTSQTSCISCVSNYYLQSDFSCTLTCSTQYFANSLTFTCDLCNLTICSACNVTANNCTSCANGYFYDSLSSLCVLVCPSGYYSESMTRTCKACQFPCTECTNTSYCTGCSTNYKLYLNRCYSSCPIGYYGTTTCSQCPTNCEICTSQTNCTKCSSNYYVESGSCVTTCSIGLYKGKQDMTNYDYCVQCPSNCLNCSDYTTCSLCVSGFYLFNGLCLSTCPILHYADSTLMSCEECPENCVSCVNNTYCTQCVNSYIYQNQCLDQCPSKTYVFNEEECVQCVSPCDECLSEYECTTCISGYLYYSGYCVEKCPSDVWYYPSNNSCSASCPYNKYEAEMICYVSGCGGKLVEMNGYCLANCPIGYYVSKSESCISCSLNTEICKNLFIADLEILRSEQLTLTLYYSQEAETIQSVDDVNATFTDENNELITLNLSSYSLTPYSLEMKYDYQPVEFINVYLTIPYINSLTSEQAISQCYYTTLIYYFNDYESDSESIMYTIANIVPVIMCAGLLICILSNIISKSSYFLQLLDFMQLAAACLYLDIQYPQYLEQFLSKLSLSLFSFMPKMIQHYPYSFSSSKYVYHNVDTSLTRTHALTFIIFIVLLVVMCVVVAIDAYFKPLPKLIDRIKHRYLNDLLSIFAFPLLLFSFPFTHAITVDILLGIVVILVTTGWVIFISNLIIQAKEMSDLKGLLADYEAVSNKLGLMYTPFSYIRRIIVALLFSIFPEKPLAALTLLLIFTILILICLFFYQPFASQVTDYISMSLELTLIVFITLIVLIGLDIFPEGANRVCASLGIILVSIAMGVGLGWLCYLSVGGMKKFCENPNQEDEKDTEDCIKEEKQSHSNNQEPHLKETEQHEAEYSATNFINPSRQIRKNNVIEDIEENEIHSHSNKEEFKHWNDEDESEQSESSQNDENNNNKSGNKNIQLPEMLMKKKIENNQEENENNKD